MEISDKKLREITLKDLMVLMISDIDIFLLQEEDQLTDKDKTYTKEEIREQLSNTLLKCTELFAEPVGNVLDVPLYNTLKLFYVHNSAFSDEEKNKHIKRLVKK